MSKRRGFSICKAMLMVWDKTSRSYESVHALSSSGIGPLSPRASKPLGGVTRLRNEIEELAKRNVELSEALLREQHLRQKLAEEVSNGQQNGCHKLNGADPSEVRHCGFTSSGCKHAFSRPIWIMKLDWNSPNRKQSNGRRKRSRSRTDWTNWT